MKKIPAIAFMALASLAFAGDVNGKWVASMETPNGTRETTFNFKVDGAKLTGTVSGRQGDSQITDGKMDGDNISFSVVRNFNGNEMKAIYKGMLSGAELKLKMDMGERSAEMVAKRPAS